ncbi:MAG: dicarboxylate/amino acid:cation symporter [Oscillospiraceae bacterium]|nr:dicarboxylate/amino acid:cation symporter [Oscillospiraceae bacterium]
MKKLNDNNKLAIQMLIAMVGGIVVGMLFMALRESLGADSNAWTTINKLLFQDITAAGGESAVGLFYIGGQLFIRSLQLIIVPMVFSSVVMAISEINEARTLGRIAGKTIGWFMMTSGIALVLAGVIALMFFNMGFFHVQVDGLTGSAGSTGSNPLLVLLNIVPSNIGATLSVNNAVLGVVFIAVVVGLAMNMLGLGKESVIYRLCEEVSKIIVVFLNFAVKKFGPAAIFMLLCRTFATYGIDYLKPAAVYVILTVVLLLVYLFIGYPLYIALVVKQNPITFIKKIFKVIVFGFSTSSSAATLPLNIDTTTKELGADNQIASFVLPLGMTINMDGTAIMQVVAALFIAGCGGYDVTAFQLLIIMVLALIASMGTPAAPGAGAVILFTILSGMGFVNDQALIAYSLILAINRPIEMLVTSLNVTGDSVTAIAVAKSEGKLNAEAFNAK